MSFELERLNPVVGVPSGLGQNAQREFARRRKDHDAEGEDQDSGVQPDLTRPETGHLQALLGLELERLAHLQKQVQVVVQVQAAFSEFADSFEPPSADRQEATMRVLAAPGLSKPQQQLLERLRGLVRPKDPAPWSPWERLSALNLLVDLDHSDAPAWDLDAALLLRQCHQELQQLADGLEAATQAALHVIETALVGASSPDAAVSNAALVPESSRQWIEALRRLDTHASAHHIDEHSVLRVLGI